MGTIRGQSLGKNEKIEKEKKCKWFKEQQLKSKLYEK